MKRNYVNFDLMFIIIFSFKICFLERSYTQYSCQTTIINITLFLIKLPKGHFTIITIWNFYRFISSENQSKQLQMKLFKITNIRLISLEIYQLQSLCIYVYIYVSISICTYNANSVFMIKFEILIPFEAN